MNCGDAILNVGNEECREQGDREAGENGGSLMGRQPQNGTSVFSQDQVHTVN